MDATHILDLLDPYRTKRTLKEKKEALIEEVKKRSVHDKVEVKETKIEDKPQVIKPFDIAEFEKELYDLSELQNQVYAKISQYINAYDIASNCIRQVVYKLQGTPVTIFADRWLPIILRTTIGNAIHDFVQTNTSQFTEIERSIKVPSINFSGRIDALIGDSILVEIKSVTYSDYEKILKSKQPRDSDFLQTIVYKYILEHHLQECKMQSSDVLRTKSPQLDKYNIKTIQFIYIAHDLCAADIEDFGVLLKTVSKIKKLLKSRVNKFFFMMTMNIDVSENKVDEHINYVKTKIARINEYLKNNKLPESTDEFFDNSKCFFCMYNSICPYSKK